MPSTREPPHPGRFSSTAGADIKGTAQEEFPQIYPKPGWVEHNPDDLWNSQIEVARRVLHETGTTPGELSAVGITNQRETTLVWDRRTGRPVCNAIVWQDRRTAPICEELKKGLRAGRPAGNTCGLHKRNHRPCNRRLFFGYEDRLDFAEREGQRGQAPATGRRKKATSSSARLIHGCLWKLTGGKVHATDVTNASRTMLYDINTLCWDETLLTVLDIPKSMLPEVYPSAHIFGELMKRYSAASGIPVAGIAGDQQAALFGQACFEPGMVKSTYGTGTLF